MRAILLLLISAALTAKLFTPLGPLLVYLAVGYLFVLHAAVVRPRLSGRAARWVPVVTLALWTLGSVVLKEMRGLAALDRFPNLGLTGLPGLPTIVGASYIFLKVYDLIRRAQRGDPPPGLVHYMNQMLFTPSFSAGPIAGPDVFRLGFQTSRAAAAEGLNRILGGVLKLFVVAQILESINVFASPTACATTAFMSKRDLWLELYGTSLWIYFNFAGYSDLAIGAGLLCGVRLPENFDAPYLAPNPSEFWQRWHMSFTAWLREHVFGAVSKRLLSVGLGGGVLALVVSTTTTMVACGLWHRLSVPFLVWGLYHAFVLIAHQLFASRLKPRLARGGLEDFFGTRGYRVLATIATFHLVAIGWLLFFPLDAPLGEHFTLLGRLFLP